MAVDRAGNVYIADTLNSTIRKATSSGVVTSLAGVAGVTGSTDGTNSAARFYYASALTVGTSGLLYEVECGNNIVRVITRDGAVTTVAGWAGHQGTNDGDHHATFLLHQNSDIANPGGWQTCGLNITNDGRNKSITFNSPTDSLFFRLSGN